MANVVANPARPHKSFCIASSPFYRAQDRCRAYPPSAWQRVQRAVAPLAASGPWPFSAAENPVTRGASGTGFRMNPQPNGAETVDQDEVARFSRLAGDWWDPRGPMAALHKFNPVRLTY